MIDIIDADRYLQVGSIHEIDFPFVVSERRETSRYHDYDWIHRSWKPGVQNGCNYESYTICHGIGKRRLEVMSIADMPENYHSRVIYKQTWIQPDGCEYPPKILMCTPHAFVKFCTMSPDYDEIVEKSCDSGPEKAGDE